MLEYSDAETRRILIELEGSDEPAWAYLEFQHRHIMSSIRNLYAKAQEQARGQSLLHSERYRTILTNSSPTQRFCCGAVHFYLAHRCAEEATCYCELST